MPKTKSIMAVATVLNSIVSVILGPSDLQTKLDASQL